ncbi:MAG: hypothetical protein KatS3mg027_1216 [Bacteroidia bacterium]|nr:MAG: hypothetical protein KatS3mg027_1216 [Bacteroidia bacterium]
MKRFLFYILLILPIVFYKAQTKKQLYKAAESSFENKDYENATYYYHLLVLRDSLNPEYQYKLATSARLNYQNDLSFYWYKKLFEENAEKYPDVIFYLGLLSKNKGDYKTSIKFFDKFVRKYKSAKKYPEWQKLVKEAQLHIKGCENALYLKDNPHSVIIHHIDTNVNTKLSEYAPFMNDTALFFSSLTKLNNGVIKSQLFFSKTQNDSFFKSRSLPFFINDTSVHTANLCFYKNYLFFTKCEPVNATEFECKIYVSQFINHHWTDPMPLTYEINHPRYTTTHPFATYWNGKNVLFFSSNRPNGLGGMDIWYAFFDNQLNFEKPINAGKNINTEYNEITPYFDAKKEKLFFSSDSPLGMGGYDIYFSNFLSNAFQPNVNAGFPINTSFNDLYYSLSMNRKKAFFSSNRVGSFFEAMPNCCNDLYFFDTGDTTQTKDTISIPTKKDTIVQTFSKLKLLVPLTLYFHNDEPDPKTKKIFTDKNYQKTCELYLQMKEEYIREYSSGLKGKEKEEAIDLVNRFFEDSVEYGFSQLEKFANYLEELMDKKAIVKIVMKGYCSPLASTEYNINLAKRRISSLRNYFYQYKNGKFMPFIKNENDSTIGKILLVDEEIGELPFSKVSDDLKDKRNSVYSPYAASERKIQIIAVELE